MPDATAAHQRVARLRRWRWAIRGLQVVVAIALFGAVWLIGFRGDSGVAPVVPDTTSQFSLDLRVVASSDHDLVYAVEQRARPAYRIFSFNPSSGAIETVFTVPEDAIIYGIALSPDRSTLAVSYSEDFQVEGSGLWILDLDTDDFTEVREIETNHYLVDPVWMSDGDAILATRVDRTTEDETLAVVQVSLDGTLAVRANNAVDPAVDGDDLYFLQVGADSARRQIGRMTGDGERQTIEFQDGSFDLDHLISGGESLSVAALEGSDEPSITLGEAADAHGNHDVRSAWWSVQTTADGNAQLLAGLDPIIVYDAAAMDDGSFVYATLEGLAIGDGDRIDLIKSRAIRFVAA